MCAGALHKTICIYIELIDRCTDVIYVTGTMHTHNIYVHYVIAAVHGT